MNKHARRAAAVRSTQGLSSDSLCGGYIVQQFRSPIITVILIVLGLAAGSGIPSTVHAGTITLTEVLHGVEQHAPALKAAYATADVTSAKRHQAISNFLGEVDVYAHDLHFNDNRLTRPISPPISLSALTFDKNQIGYGLIAKLPIDISGRMFNNFHALTHQSKAARADAEDAHLSIMYGATSLYRELERIVGQREALLKQEEALQKHVQVADEAVRIGRIALVEKLRLVAEIKAVEGRLVGLEGIESGIRARLAALLDIPSFTDSIQVCSNQPDSIPVLPNAINDRPDVQAAMERSQSGKSAVKAAWGGFLPDLFVIADWQQNQGYNGSGNNDATWQVAIQASLPLWKGTKRIAALHEAQARSRAAEYYAEAQRKSARAEAAAAWGAFNAARAQYSAAESALDAAKEVARIQTDRFNNGRLSAADLVDAEASLAGARSELSTSLVRWWQADDALRQSVGLPPAAYGN
jgi:outer membrane protein